MFKQIIEGRYEYVTWWFCNDIQFMYQKTEKCQIHFYHESLNFLPYWVDNGNKQRFK